MKGEMKMKKPNLSKLTHSMFMVLDRNSPKILMGVGIAGMITTAYLSAKAAPKAVKLLDEKKEELKTDKLSAKETVKTTWKCYAPAVTTGVLSTVCLLGSSSISTRRTAALATACKLSETAFNEYKEKVVETIGIEKEKEIKEDIAKDTIKKNPPSPSNTVVFASSGDILCYDSISGRYFRSTKNAIEKAVNDLNARIFQDNYISLNEFYDELDLPHIDLGSDLGWNVDAMLDVDCTDCGLSEDGIPYLVVKHYNPPKYKYSNFGY